jgi:hypothetical protein
VKTDWNFLPKERFITTVNGYNLGLGLQPGVDLPGVWNIFCLIAGDLTQFLGSNEDPAVTSNWLAAAIGASYQHLPGDVEVMGAKAERMAPGEFLETIKDFEMFIPRLIMGEAIWAERTQAAVAGFKKHNSGVVIPGNFKRNRCDA